MSSYTSYNQCHYAERSDICAKTPDVLVTHPNDFQYMLCWTHYYLWLANRNVKDPILFDYLPLEVLI